MYNSDRDCKEIQDRFEGGNRALLESGALGPMVIFGTVFVLLVEFVKFVSGLVKGGVAILDELLAHMPFSIIYDFYCITASTISNLVGQPFKILAGYIEQNVPYPNMRIILLVVAFALSAVIFLLVFSVLAQCVGLVVRRITKSPKNPVLMGASVLLKLYCFPFFVGVVCFSILAVVVMVWGITGEGISWLCS